MMFQKQPAQTDVPDWMMTRLHQIANAEHHRKLNRMYIEMIEGFMLVKPYKAEIPIRWYKPKSNSADLIWKPMNIVLPTELKNKIDLEIQVINISREDDGRISQRIFLYTCALWWVTQIHPTPGLEMFNV